MENKNWPDAVRLKMIERTEYYEPNGRIYQYGYYDGYQHAEPWELHQRIEKLEAALRELVELKDMKVKAHSFSSPISLLEEYNERYTLAWNAARELVTPLPEDKK
jgi:hypothetical protein